MPTRKIGKSTLVTSDRTKQVLQRMQRAKVRAVLAMADEAKVQMQEVYFTDGDGTWAPNRPGTIAWKGFNGPMRGLTASLSRDIQIRPSPVTTGAQAVGWFEDPHPDTEGRLSMGALATVHEFGLDYPVHIEAREWASKVHDTPYRAEAVYRAGRQEYAHL